MTAHRCLARSELPDGQAFSRAAGAQLVPGNSIRVLKNARENYPAWLEAIGRATRSTFLVRAAERIRVVQPEGEPRTRMRAPAELVHDAERTHFQRRDTVRL